MTKTIWIEFKDGRKTEYEAVSFTVEDGAAVLWNEKQRVAAIVKGDWVRIAEGEWQKTTGPQS